jgi:hypothetical protein
MSARLDVRDLCDGDGDGWALDLLRTRGRCGVDEPGVDKRGCRRCSATSERRGRCSPHRGNGSRPGGGSCHDQTLRGKQRRDVAVTPGTTSGPLGEGWARVSLATDTDDLLEGLARLEVRR